MHQNGSHDGFATASRPDSDAEAQADQREDDLVYSNRAGPAGGARAPLDAGSRLFGFTLLRELGRGAYGRVYLAQQEDLAHRLVVLKVSTNVVDESRALAQLVHTHIVPIYSLHRGSPLQAACMPYLGATTLAHVLTRLRAENDLPRSGKDLVSTIEGCSRTALPPGHSHLPATVVTPGTEAFPSVPPLSSPSAPLAAASHSQIVLEMLERFSYVEAVLWIGSCLADGLAHAHERGILHHDLKPANVLLTDEGLPMLLDFNLAGDARRVEDEPGRVGGTLAYMAPEHLEAFQGQPATVDARSDLYSLGIVLYELLTRQFPFSSVAPNRST